MRPRCGLWPSCEKNPRTCLDNNAYVAIENTFNAAWGNLSDPGVTALAVQLDNLSTAALTGADSRSAVTNINAVGETYQALIARCGQIIQGQ